MRLIDADALIENVFKNDISYNAFKNLVKRQPTLKLSPQKTGRWVDVSDNEWKIICSSCKRYAYIDSEEGYKRFDYCPWCGAKMKEW